MIIFLSGGVRSGKSTLGEKYANDLVESRKIYLATSKPYDTEMDDRIKKHQADRKSKNFLTIERSADISKIIDQLKSTDVILLDCLGNLVANEMFADLSFIYTKELLTNTIEKIYTELTMVSSFVSALIIVSNELFQDGISYGHDAKPYLDVMAALHRMITKDAEIVVECVYGQNIYYKGKENDKQIHR